MTGYLHRQYAESFAEFGVPSELPASQGWILKRRIANAEAFDAMGCYPIFACGDWSSLKVDLENIDREIVCLSLVTDPFGAYDSDYLQTCFPDVAKPFKEHFVVDLKRPLDTFIHPHHRRNARRARRDMQIERCENPPDFLDEWNELYATLIERHGISGLSAFSNESFARQFQVPGLVAFRATRAGTTLGMLLWYVQENRAYYHLGAYSLLGYDLRASFALFDHSIEYFAGDGLEWLSLGAGAGVGANADSGLNRFKQGWSTGTRTAYFCGRIFDRDRYQEIVRQQNPTPNDFFPAYRAGEFT